MADEVRIIMIVVGFSVAVGDCLKATKALGRVRGFDETILVIGAAKCRSFLASGG